VHPAVPAPHHPVVEVPEVQEAAAAQVAEDKKFSKLIQ
jgi:hypothetical protein